VPSVSNHPKVECPPDLRAALLFSQSEEGQPLAVTVIGATFRIEGNRVVPAEEPLEIKPGGEFWGEPGKSSYKLEPQVAFVKNSTDVVLLGHAYSLGRSSVDVAVHVGPLRQIATVTGDRYWIKSLGAISMTWAEPFERLPLIYERAFGGWDRSHPDEERHAFEPRNPLGTGFRSRRGRFEEGVRLPNIEDSRNRLREYGDAPPPAGFGFTCPDWQPRASFAGTYDEAWMNDRMPLLPLDFDRRFFNAASPGLVAPRHLNGDEPVFIENASPGGTISFNLPGVPRPECRVQLKGRRDERVETNLDTVIINTDENLLMLVWRGYLPVKNGLQDVLAVRI